ncbi:MAG: hypothetical protein HY763_11000, partial [Planctomycetes bacterium]|nr:hypothetical protein [Planctomycetota bacterium]
GMSLNFENAKGKHFRGSIWQSSEQDDGDRLRQLLAENRNYDRRLLKALPANRRMILRGYARRLWFWKRPTGVAVASVLSPLGHFAASAGGNAPPIDLGALRDHVERLVGDRRVPHIIGVCSPTGFTDDARNARLDAENVTVVLVEPRAEGGWSVHASGDAVDPRLLKIFDPEGPKQKVERVRRLVEEHSADLLTGGVSLETLVREANLPEPAVRQALENLSAEDPELRVAAHGNEFVLFRGAPATRQEKKTVNVIERIKQLFSGEGDAGQKINVLSERRALLAQRRDRMYEDIAKLEHKEAELLAAGKAATSAVPRRRLAAQLAQMRKDIARQNTTAAMLNQQINIISTDIHNLTLIQQGKLAELPDTETLTEHAVQAEEMLETLKADAELVGGLGMGLEQSLVSAEEEAILREFEGGEERPEKAKQPPAPEARAVKAPPNAKADSRSAPALPEEGHAPAAHEDLGGRGDAELT